MKLELVRGAEIEITETMIEAGARPLFEDDKLSIGPSEARYFAEKVLRCALSAVHSENPPAICRFWPPQQCEPEGPPAI